MNPIAGLLPGHSPLPASAAVNGLGFESLLRAIIESAVSRKLPGTSTYHQKMNTTFDFQTGAKI